MGRRLSRAKRVPRGRERYLPRPPLISGPARRATESSAGVRGGPLSRSGRSPHTHPRRPSRLPIPEKAPLCVWSGSFGRDGPPPSSWDGSRQDSHLLDPRTSSFHSNLKTNTEETQNKIKKQAQNEKKTQNPTKNLGLCLSGSTALPSTGCWREGVGGDRRGIARRRPRTFRRAPGFRWRGSGGDGRAGLCIREARSPPGKSWLVAAELAWLAGAPAMVAEREK